TFWQFVRAFYEEHRFARYYTTSALQTLNDVAGADFTAFFDEWIHGKGWPQVETTWEYDAGAKVVKVTAAQVQDPAEFGVYTLAGARALEYSFDDGDAMTPACVGKL